MSQTKLAGAFLVATFFFFIDNTNQTGTTSWHRAI